MIFSEILPSFSYSLPLIAKEWKKDGRISEIIITNKIKKMKYFLLMSKITTSPTNREILLKVQVFVKNNQFSQKSKFSQKKVKHFQTKKSKILPIKIFWKIQNEQKFFLPDYNFTGAVMQHKNIIFFS